MRDRALTPPGGEAGLAAQMLAAVPEIYALLSTLHLLGVAVLLGPVLLADLRLLGWLGPALDPAVPTLLRAARHGFALASVTGALLFAVQPVAYLNNPAFLVKMSLVALALLNAAFLALGRRWWAARGAALLSLLLWLGVLFMGQWIAFA